MNVGIAVHRYDLRDGTGGYVAELLPRIAAAHEVTLYAARVRSPVPAGVRVIAVPALMSRAYTAVLTFPTAFRAVRRTHDLVHVQGWTAGEADVVTAHIVMAAWRRAARAAGVRPPPGERVLGGVVQRMEARLFRRGARHVIAPSHKVRHEIAQLYGRTRQVTVVPHGFPNLPALKPGDRAEARRHHGFPANAVVALFVGDTRKGFAVALEAVRRTPAVHLAVVSRSPAPEALQGARAGGLDGRLHWIGPLADPAPAYAAADLLLHPTIYDSFGLVVAEAMAWGLPVIVTAAAGISELLEHERSGWIVRGDPVSGTSEALAALAENADRRRSLADAGRARAVARSWDAVARETLQVYERVGARSHRR